MSFSVSEAAPGMAQSNNLPPPPFELPYPAKPEDITANIMKLNELIPDERFKFLISKLTQHIHTFAKETNLTTEEWMSAILFLTRVGQKCTDLRQEMILLSDVLSVSSFVDLLNNPNGGKATESSVLGPFYTEDAPDVATGESIASEGKGDYLYVSGKILNTEGKPIPDAVIETWETDSKGGYDVQYAVRDKPDCRGKLRTDKDGNYAYRAIVPVAYPIPGDGPVGELLLKLNRHNMRPNHLHIMVDAPGYRRLVTALYAEGDKYLESDAVFGVRKSLVVNYKTVQSEEEARAKGFVHGDTFKVLEQDFVLMTEAEAEEVRRNQAPSIPQ